MGTRAACRAGIQHPGRGGEVFHQPVAVAVDDDPRLGKACAQQSVTIACRHLMAMDQHQEATRQWLLQPFRQMDQQAPVLLRPFSGNVVVSEHRQHTAQAGLELGENGGVTDVSAVHGEIAAVHNLLDARIERAVGIGQKRDAHLGHGRDRVQEHLD